MSATPHDTASERAPLLLGVDGGGSKTMAVVATLHPDGAIEELGRGRSGPSNLRLAGSQLALASLGESINAALADADLTGSTVDSAVLALAGVSDPDVQVELGSWIDAFPVIGRVRIIHDAEPVLVAGTPDNWGIALLVGTGSVASGVDAQGRSLVRGGWGHWFGDKGSGYDLGQQALAAAAELNDGYGTDTVLLDRLKAHYGVESLRQVVYRLACSDNVRKHVAAATPVVMAAAEEGDEVALRILANGVEHLCRIAHSAAVGLELQDGYPLALAGSVVCQNRIYRDCLLPRLQANRPAPGPITFVDEPVVGCLQMAREELAAANGPKT
jgi:N-acetylglucosamine kinase-like BadF-type ATPase